MLTQHKMWWKWLYVYSSGLGWRIGDSDSRVFKQYAQNWVRIQFWLANLPCADRALIMIMRDTAIDTP